MQGRSRLEAERKGVRMRFFEKDEWLTMVWSSLLSRLVRGEMNEVFGEKRLTKCSGGRYCIIVGVEERDRAFDRTLTQSLSRLGHSPSRYLTVVGVFAEATFVRSLGLVAAYC